MGHAADAGVVAKATEVGDRAEAGHAAT